MQRVHFHAGYSYTPYFGDRWVYGVVLLGLRVRIPPSGGGAWISLVSVVCCQESLRRADSSSRGFVPTVVCVSVTVTSATTTLYTYSE